MHLYTLGEYPQNDEFREHHTELRLMLEWDAILEYCVPEFPVGRCRHAIGHRARPSREHRTEAKL